jgi:hypothetical protein
MAPTRRVAQPSAAYDAATDRAASGARTSEALGDTEAVTDSEALTDDDAVAVSDPLAVMEADCSVGGVGRYGSDYAY